MGKVLVECKGSEKKDILDLLKKWERQTTEANILCGRGKVEGDFGE